MNEHTFFTKTPEQVKKSKKKRKHAELKQDTDTDDLKNRTRFFFKSPDQWLIVGKYGRDRLEQFVIEHDFNTQNNLFGFINNVLAVVCQSIEQEGGKFHSVSYKPLQNNCSDVCRYF